MSSNCQHNFSQIPEIPRSFLIKTVIKGISSRRNFGKEEDNRLLYLVQMYGTKNWNLIASMMPFRNVRQCRDRFTNYLSPKINLRPWTKDEDLLLINKISEFGPKWVYLSQFFNGRSDNNLKNRWHTHLKHKYEKIEKVQNTKNLDTKENEVQNLDDKDHLFCESDYFFDFDSNFNDCSLII